MISSQSPQKKVKLVFGSLYAIGWLFWTLLHIVIIADYGLSTKQAITDGLVSNTLLAGVNVLVINNMRYYLPRKEKYVYVLIISIALSALWLLATRIVLWMIFKTDVAYMQLLSKTNSIRFAIAFLMTGAMTMLSLLWFTQKEQKEEEHRKDTIEKLAKEAELNKLRQQLQPHFLFNSLNSISALTVSKPEKARYMIQQLSDFLRNNLRKDQEAFCSFEEELQYLQLYLDIEKVRFGYRLKTTIEYDDEVLPLKLPAMLLQPLVENAIKFGLYDTIDEVEILIKAKQFKNMLIVAVHNPFDDYTSMPIKGTGFGLSSIRRRLFLLFGRQDLLQIQKEGQQFISTVTIPQQDESSTN